MDSPVVLIHGITASHLVQTYDDSFDVIWSAVQHRFESIEDLALDESGEVEKDPWDLIEVTRIEHLAYGELLGRLRKRFRDTPVYIFRYDWRMDFGVAADRFGSFLERLTKKTGRSRFRIVTHSAGGLVLSAFLNKNKGENLGRVARAAIVAPPFWGSVEAAYVLVCGRPVRLGFNTTERYRKVARTFPSIYQLVPGYPGAWIHPDPDADIWDVAYWQKRVRFARRPRKAHEEKQALMRRHLERAREFHRSDLLDFDSLGESDLDKFLLIYGTGEKTRVRIKVLPENSSGEIENFFDFDSRECWSDRGDGTVPVISAVRYKRIRRIGVDLSDFSAWWPTLWDDRLKIRVAGFHSMLLGLDKVQNLVMDWLAGETPRACRARPVRR